MVFEDRIADHVRMSETSLTQFNAGHNRRSWRWARAVLLIVMLLMPPVQTMAQSPDAALF